MVRVERGVLVLGRAARRAGGRDIGVYMTTEGVSAPRTRGMGWQGARLGPDRWGGPERCICWWMPVGLDLSPAGRLNAGEGGPGQQWTKSRNKGLLVVVCVCVGRLNHQPKCNCPGATVVLCAAQALSREQEEIQKSSSADQMRAWWAAPPFSHLVPSDGGLEGGSGSRPQAHRFRRAHASH